jgi:hypothetical protein
LLYLALLAGIVTKRQPQPPSSCVNSYSRSISTISSNRRGWRICISGRRRTSASARRVTSCCCWLSSTASWPCRLLTPLCARCNPGFRDEATLRAALLDEQTAQQLRQQLQQIDQHHQQQCLFRLSQTGDELLLLALQHRQLALQAADSALRPQHEAQLAQQQEGLQRAQSGVSSLQGQLAVLESQVLIDLL